MKEVHKPHSNDSTDSIKIGADKNKESEEDFDLSSRLHMHQVRFQQGTLKVAHLGPIQRIDQKLDYNQSFRLKIMKIKMKYFMLSIYKRFMIIPMYMIQLIIQLQKMLKVHHKMIARLQMISMKEMIGVNKMIQGLKIKMMLQNVFKSV